MAKEHVMLFFFAFFFCLALSSTAEAMTDPFEVAAIQELYISLNFPPQLTGWKLGVGNPCDEAWKGITCSGSSITSIKIHGLNITGILGLQLANLLQLKELDLSHNSIQGVFPFFLPPSTTHMNFSHNSLSGSLGSVFTGLKNLRQMDLSYNSFTGDLPISFVTLTCLTSLYLQNNQLTGTVNFLAGLPLLDLNIENNRFSGVVPKQLQLIPNLSIEGNMFVTGAVRPLPNTAHDRPNCQDITNFQPSNATKNHPSSEERPSNATENHPSSEEGPSNATENHPSPEENSHNSQPTNCNATGSITWTVSAVLFVIVCILSALGIFHIYKPFECHLDGLGCICGSLPSSLSKGKHRYNLLSMATQHMMLFCFALFFCMALSSTTEAMTNPFEVAAIQELYISLNFPPRLTGWKLSVGDPCDEAWKGITCSGSSITSIKIHGLNITGILGLHLANLLSLKELDLSHNSIQGVIPFSLPPSTTHMNFSHNSLSGSLGSVFTGLKNLRLMDLSYNSFTGDLPISFVTLTCLTSLYLQNNQLTGTVNFLAGLPLLDLNIENNRFSGVVPKQFQLIPNLSIEGNLFVTGAVRPLPNTTHDRPNCQDITNSQPSNATENHPSSEERPSNATENHPSSEERPSNSTKNHPSSEERPSNATENHPSSEENSHNSQPTNSNATGSITWTVSAVLFVIVCILSALGIFHIYKPFECHLDGLGCICGPLPSSLSKGKHRYNLLSMATQHMMLFCFAFFFCMALSSTTEAMTNPFEVAAIQELYISLNFPPQLTGWKLGVGDPCDEAWKGITCSGSSITSFKIHGLNITGILGLHLANPLSLKELDLIHNSTHGVVPFFLPPSTTHINLTFNQLTLNMPLSFISMKNLPYLSLSHNSMSGSHGGVFTGLKNLRLMDLSYSSFTGDLPISFVTLTCLTSLYLKNNQLTGSVNFLASLPLLDLNIENNHFSDVFPLQFELIPNLRIEGNMFVTGAVHPLPNTTPHDSLNCPDYTNSQRSNATENHPSSEEDSKNSQPTTSNATGSISWIDRAVLFVMGCIISALGIFRICKPFECQLDGLESICGSLPSSLSTASISSEQQSTVSPSLASPRPPPTVRYRRAERFSRRRSRNYQS